MTMFNSQKINNDPTPWLCECGGSRSDKPENPYGLIGHDYRLAPRPEFGNNPNPVLLAFRDYCTEASAAESHRAAVLWSDVLSGRSSSTSEAALIAAGLMATNAEYAHAEQVLARLASL